MAVTTYKTKSLTPDLTNEQIRDGYFVSSFISFESAIRLATEQFDLGQGKKPCGYRVTEQGIEYLFKS